MEDCIFCKISKGEIPCAKIWEDEKFLAFLDINPATEGMVLVIPRDHLNSYIFKNKDGDIKDIMVAAKKVAKMLESALDVDRVAVIFEGIEVNHLHIKLLPLKEGESVRILLNSEYPRPKNEDLESLALKIIAGSKLKDM